MCLYLHTQETAEFREKHANDEYITCYKVLAKDGDKLTSIIYRMTDPWYPGMRVSDRKSIAFDSWDRPCDCGCNMKKVNRGIHVYLEKPRTLFGEVCVEVKCKMSDLVGIGNYGAGPVNEAVFMAVELGVEEYNRVMGV